MKPQSFLNITFLVAWSFAFLLNGQNPQRDSLLKKIRHQSVSDSSLLANYNLLAIDYRKSGDYDSALYYTAAAINLGRELLRNETGDSRSVKISLGNTLNNRGIVFQIQGNYPEALRCHFEALQLREAVIDQKGIASSLSNIGLVYDNQGKYDEAMKNHLAALKINKNTGNKEWQAFNLNNIGNICNDLGKYEEALSYYSQCMQLMLQLNNPTGLASAYNNIGLIYEYTGKYAEAENNYKKALEIRKENEDAQGIAIVYSSLGSVYIKQKKLQEALDYLKKAEALGISTQNNEILKDTYMSWLKLDSIQGNWKEAFRHQALFMKVKDSILNQENTTKTVQAIMNYEFGKKEAAANAEHEKKIHEAEEKNKRQKIYLTGSALLGLAVAAVAVFIFRSLRLTRRQKQMIEEEKQKADKAYEKLNEKNKEVMDSIHYAKRIQQALMTSELYIDKILTKVRKP